MSAQYKEIISEPEFFRASYAMVVLASAIMLVRIGVQVWRRKAMELQDYLIYLAFALFLALSICYLVNISTIFDISKVLVGSLEPWPTFQSDFVLNVRIVFVTTVLFWLTLWSVKLSLLALYKKLLEGLPRVWTRLWWAVFTFCIVVSPCYCMLFNHTKLFDVVCSRLYRFLSYFLSRIHRLNSQRRLPKYPPKHSCPAC